MRFKSKAMKATGLIETLTLTADSADDLYLLVAMVRAMVLGGKIRADPGHGYPPNWIEFTAEAKKGRKTNG